MTGVQAFWQFESKWDIRSAVDSGFHPSLATAMEKHKKILDHHQGSDVSDESDDEYEFLDEETEDSGMDEFLFRKPKEDNQGFQQERDQSYSANFSLSLKLPIDSDLVYSGDYLSNVELLKTEKSGYTVNFSRQATDESEIETPMLDTLKPATVCRPFIQQLFNKCTSLIPGDRPSAEDITRYLSLYPTHFVKFNCEPLHLPVTRAAQCSMQESSSDELLSGNSVLLYGPRNCCAVKRNESGLLTVAQIPLEGPLSARCTAIAVLGNKMWVGWAIGDNQHWVTVYRNVELEMIATISVEDSALCFQHLPRLSGEETVVMLTGLRNGVAVVVHLQQNKLFLKSKFVLGDPDHCVTCCCCQEGSELVWIGCGTSLFLLDVTDEEVVQSWSAEQESCDMQCQLENLFNSSVGVWSQVCKGTTLKLWEESGSCRHVIALDASHE